MTTASSLFDEFAAALQFPYYFGHNWDALDECLCDLSWLNAKCFVLAIFDCEHLLSQDVAQSNMLLQLLTQACLEWASPVSKGEAWDRPAVPFHVVLQFNKIESEESPPAMSSLDAI